jgi:hypothetical protein
MRPTSVSANPSVGIVSPTILSAVRFSSSRPSASGSRLLSTYSDCCTALSRSCSLNGLSRMPADATLRNAAVRKYCCRLTRSRSPRPFGKL